MDEETSPHDDNQQMNVPSSESKEDVTTSSVVEMEPNSTGGSAPAGFGGVTSSCDENQQEGDVSSSKSGEDVTTSSDVDPKPNSTGENVLDELDESDDSENKPPEDDGDDSQNVGTSGSGRDSRKREKPMKKKPKKKPRFENVNGCHQESRGGENGCGSNEGAEGGRNLIPLLGLGLNPVPQEDRPTCSKCANIPEDSKQD